jgi:hypothetical protein
MKQRGSQNFFVRFLRGSFFGALLVGGIFQLISSYSDRPFKADIRQLLIMAEKSYQKIEEIYKKIIQQKKIPEKPEEMAGRESIEENLSSHDVGEFKAEVSGASMDDDSIYIAVKLINKTTEPIFLVSDSGARPHLIEGKSAKEKELIRIQSIGETGEGFYSYKDKNAYTIIPVKSSRTPTFIFKSDQTIERAFDLDLVFLRLKNDEITRFPVSLRVIIDK